MGCYSGIVSNWEIYFISLIKSVYFGRSSRGDADTMYTDICLTTVFSYRMVSEIMLHFMCEFLWICTMIDELTGQPLEVSMQSSRLSPPCSDKLCGVTQLEQSYIIYSFIFAVWKLACKRWLTRSSSHKWVKNQNQNYSYDSAQERVWLLSGDGNQHKDLPIGRWADGTRLESKTKDG